MDTLYSYLLIGGVTAAPFVLLYQYFRITKAYASQPKTRKLVVLDYFAGMINIAYAVGIVALWIYMWFIYTPNTSPETSFSPEAQRLIGIVFFGGLTFLFAAPIAAASLLTLRGAYKQQK